MPRKHHQCNGSKTSQEHDSISSQYYESGADDTPFDADSLYIVSTKQSQQLDKKQQCPTESSHGMEAKDGGSLEHDLNKLSAGVALTSAPIKTQKPLQIHLDVAAVEHNIDSNSELHGERGVPERHGLLSHYLQLADVDKERKILRKQLDSSNAVDKKPPSYKMLSSEVAMPKEQKKRKEAANGKVARLRYRITHKNRPRQSKTDNHKQCFSSPQLGDCSSKCRPDTQAQTNASCDHSKQKCMVDDRSESSLKDQVIVDNVESPVWSDVNLTRFLPYALSAPGIQSLAGTPPVAQEDSVADMSSWIKNREHLLDWSFGDNAPSKKTVLDDRRQQLLDGIKQLLLHQRFICLLAQAMMQYGAPLHHLEDNLSRMSRHLCIAATFTTMPGLVLISIEDTSTFTSETKIIRCPNGLDMYRLELTDRIFRKVSKGKMTVHQGTVQLTDIMNMPPLFAWYWQLAVWGISSWSVCLLAFSGSWIDSLAALVLGMIAGCLNLLASRLKGFTNLFEATVSVVCGFLATVFAKWICFGAVTLSATVVLLPGLLLTTGVIELASRNMHAGTIRVVYALMIAFVIAFGINLGNNVYAEIFGRLGRQPDMNIGSCSPVSQWWWWLAFPVAISTICLLINVHPRQWHACIIVAGLMFVVFWGLVIRLNLQIIGPVVSAFVLGVAANIWSKIFKHNAYATLLPGMMILVPGSVGVRGIMSMFNNTDDGASLQLAMQMIQTSLSIMVGLFASSFAVYPRGKKQSALLTV
ncbi:pheromone-regulated protein prm10 [Coemansia sp. RSA 485]|nr:pheromone-regulated protein prm10 [Coemansia sp. RSA 485]